MPGTGSEIQIAVNSTDTITSEAPAALFWRVKIDDQDTDLDELTDWEETKIGTSVNNPDTDDDGIPDSTDPLPLQNLFLIDPDGSALPASMNTGLIGRWDFEAIYPSSTPNDFAYGINRFYDSTSNARHAGTFDVGLDPLGMPSKAATAPTRGFMAIPASLLNNRAVYTVSLWAKLPSDAISTDASHHNEAGIFSNHDYVPYGNTTYGRQNLNALWITNSGNNEILRAGAYYWSNYKLVSGTPVPANPIIYNFSGVEITRPKGTFTDDQWHHYLYVCNDAITSLYIDGVLIGTSNHTPADITNNGVNTAVSVGRLYGKALGTTPYQSTVTGGVLKGSIDRLRVWSRALGQADATTLFHQDISGDGLWDITSVQSRLWRDTNSNAIATPDEFTFINSPYKYYPPTTDSDGDGATDLQEQAAKTYAGFADSDGGGLPDGFEIKYGLNPLNPADDHIDSDGDGVNNYVEWIYNTDPTNASVGGPPNIPPAEQMSIRLGIGDQSGSESEDYSLNVFRLDPLTGEETRIFTLDSEGHGEYREAFPAIFRKGESYSFQIQWNSTNNGVKPATPTTSAEGPDFDYTFIVEPQNADSGILIDSYDPVTKSTDESKKLLNEDANDVATTQAEFKKNYQDRRVMLFSAKVVELAPQVLDETNVVIPNSEKPSYGARLTPFVEENPFVDRIAHRELKVKIGNGSMSGKKVTWSMTPVPNASPADFRGSWASSPNHKNRFESSTTYGAYDFQQISQLKGETKIDTNGYTAIRVNVPPIGYNKARIQIQIEDYATPFHLIDMEVPAVVVIDPGHGGTVNLPGSSFNNATSPSGVLEKAMALDLGLALRTSLQTQRSQSNLNLRIFMTREVDQNVAGNLRAAVARDNGADAIFIIHFNASEFHTARGTLEVLRTDGNVNSAQDSRLATAVINRMVPALQQFDAGANIRASVVNNTAVASDINLGNTSTYHPIRAAYCEVEFIDFGENTAVLTDDSVDILFNTGPNTAAVRIALANAIRDGILQDLIAQP